jgi:hypothetical protein
MGMPDIMHEVEELEEQEKRLTQREERRRGVRGDKGGLIEEGFLTAFGMTGLLLRLPFAGSALATCRPEEKGARLRRRPLQRLGQIELSMRGGLVVGSAGADL